MNENGKDCTISSLRNNNIKMKKVSFDSNVRILNMHAWSFAYREARKNEWIANAARFELRKLMLEAKLVENGFFSSKMLKNSNSLK